MTYQNAFVSESRQLRSKGQQLSQLHQIYKALGLVTTGVSGLALITSGGALLPLIMGLVAYGGSVLSENQRTRKLKPLPWVSSDLTAIASASLHEAQQATLGTQAHHYLEPEDKALFYLTNFQGHKLTQLAEQMEPDQFTHILTNLVDHLVTAHEPALNHPELLGQALKTDLFEIAIANLPKAASQVVGAKTRLAAVDVQALPVATAKPESTDLSTLSKSEAPGGLPIRDDWQAVFSRVVNQAEFPSVFIYGRQGTGKTTTVNYLLSLITNRKVVLDPHYRYGAWKGCEVIGKGMNYTEIDEFIQECLEDIQTRYQIYATTPNYRPNVVTIVCEELTNWAEHITKGKAFTKASLSDFRKAGYQSISVAHGETNTARGGATGTRKMRDEGEVHIKLLAKGKARITFPDEDPFILHYPNLEAYTQVTDSHLAEHNALAEKDFPSQIVEEVTSKICVEASPEKEHTPKDNSPTIPGLNITQNALIKRIANYAKKDGTLTASQLLKKFKNSNRPAVKPYLKPACRYLANSYPTYSLTEGEGGFQLTFNDQTRVD